MPTLAQAAADFLAQKRLAIVGVSRRADQPANFNFRKLRVAGYTVFPVNPAAATVEGATCYPNLRAIPGGVDAVLIYTPPAATAAVVRECADLGIARVWIHRSLGGGSYSAEAEAVARERGLALIAGGCPAMFCAPVDVGHKCLRWLLTFAGRLPKEVAAPTSQRPV
ncbi:MAG: CoA-binding protein [Opitutae bacterium]|nr:CoA-binding protein [Opitutae bacterium]